MKKLAAIFALAAASVSCNEINKLVEPSAPKPNAVEFSTTDIVAIPDAQIVQEKVNNHYKVTVNYKDSLMVKTVGQNVQSTATPVDMTIHFRDVKDSADIAKIKSLKQYLVKNPQPK